MERKENKAPYEAPMAAFVALTIAERLMGCGQQNTLTCGINAYYQ
jgi:hypothetical protein